MSRRLLFNLSLGVGWGAGASRCPVGGSSWWVDIAAKDFELGESCRGVLPLAAFLSVSSSVKDVRDTVLVRGHLSKVVVNLMSR